MADPQMRDRGPAFSPYLRLYHTVCNQDQTAPDLDAYYTPCSAMLSTRPGQKRSVSVDPTSCLISSD